ncbi:MAG: heme-binding protein [Proteobacteria bacterium]|nr:heme-binding protein [Verrucomicrobiota bacterium]NBU09864.1 heme-binding protein [Pseudomonadota bacterium]
MTQLFRSATVVLLLGLMPVAAQDAKPAKKAAKKAPAPNAGLAVNENKATPLERIKVMKDFKVELLHSVPATEQGSWVNLCTDGKGRIIASDQYGGLFRFAPPAPGKPLDPATIEKIPAAIRAANGLLWFNNGLYVAVNDYENKIPSGLYRVTSSKGDDTLDKVELLREMNARGDHGVHAILPAPDGKSLFLITGNGTKPTAFSGSKVPLVWGEDHVLPRMPDGRGFMREVLGPGGIIYQVSLDGKTFTPYSSGYRNIFDGAFNRDGELFTYDADMEYDFNTPWYRPTRVCLATSGSEYGWRNGAGKRPEWYPDNLGPVLNIGPGSPTGMTFGYGAKFPAKYQEALFCLDWSWGKLYAVHLKPEGSGYTATKEEFLSGAPMPLTDAIIHPQDGAMYFAIGGRKVQSGLYRVTYTGKESTAPAKPSTDAVAAKARALRHSLEAFHGHADPQAIATAWPHLASSDRYLRWAARTALEWQPAGNWAEKALTEKDPAKQVEALLGLARITGVDPQHRKPTDPAVDTAIAGRIYAALGKLDWQSLNQDQRLALVRTVEICLVRFGQPDEATRQRLIAKLDPLFPAENFPLNWVLCETLVALQSPNIAAKGIAALKNAPGQEEQMEYARSLRMLKTGWTTALRTEQFNWFLRAANYRGGASFEKFIEFIRTGAEESLSASEKTALADLLAKKPVKKSPLEALAEAFAGRTQVKEWKLDELAAAAEKGGLQHRNYANGRKMFGAAACFACHRFGNEGGMTGPDLTTAGARYSARDFIDQIINPSKEINEQFVPVVLTKTDGETITGIIVNLNGDSVQVNTDLTDPNQRIGVDRKQVVKMEPSKVSPMPEGLLNMLKQEEILDLVAYVLSGGDPKHAMFK